VHEVLNQDREEPVAVTGLNLEQFKSPSRLIKILAPRRGHPTSCPERKTRQSDQGCMNKKESGVNFCEYPARIQENLLLLGYCGLGTAVKVSTILFDDKNLEYIKGLTLANARDPAMFFGLSPR
jgi:hypothetical protein